MAVRGRVSAVKASAVDISLEDKSKGKWQAREDTVVFRKSKQGWNTRASILMLLLALSATMNVFLRTTVLCQHWMDALVMLLQLASFLLCLGNGLALMRLKPSPVVNVMQGQKTRKTLRLQVLIPCYTEALSVVQPAVLAAATADLPKGCTRTIWLLDDGNSKEKKSWVASLGLSEVRYLSNRSRLTSEINGKAANLNHAVHHIYAEQRGALVDEEDAVAVFDCDQVCSPDFFTKLVPHLLKSEKVALVLTPQRFNNVTPSTDLPFNHCMPQYWEYRIPGFVCWGHFECTGTNYIARSLALQEVGWWPEDTTTEDTALGLRLAIQKYEMVYVMEHLAIGEAPVGSAVFRQRSKWCKGHFQIVFRRDSLLFDPRLPLVSRLVVLHRTILQIVAAATPILIIQSLSNVVNPQSASDTSEETATYWQSRVWTFVLAFATFTIIHFSSSMATFYSICTVSNSGGWLWFTYFKAFVNSLLTAVGLKAMSRFKVTDKLGSSGVSAIEGRSSQAAAEKRSTEVTRPQERREAMPWRDLWPYVFQLGASLAGVLYGMNKFVFGGMRQPGYVLCVITCLQYCFGPVALLSYFWRGTPVTNVGGTRGRTALVAFSLAVTLARWVAIWL